MALNPDTSDAILTDRAQFVHSYSNLTSINVAGTIVPLASNVRRLGTKLDSNLMLDNHINSVSQACFYHIRALHFERAQKEPARVIVPNLPPGSSSLQFLK